MAEFKRGDIVCNRYAGRRNNLSAYCPNCGVLMDKEEEQ